MKKFLRLSIVGLIGLLMALFIRYFTIGSVEVNQRLALLNLPPGFKIALFADLSSLGKPRMMTFDKEGNLFVTMGDTGKVVQINPDGETKVIANGLDLPNGIDFLGDDLLIGVQNGIVKIVKQKDGWNKPIPLISNLPTGGHKRKSIKVSPEGFLFVNVGSSCNVCKENDSTRATLLRYTSNGEPAGVDSQQGNTIKRAMWAQGLRNTQGYAWHPVTGAMFATNEGADNRSDSLDGPVNDDIPPEHINIIEAGHHYGWPYCWGNPAKSGVLFQDPNFVGENGFCQTAHAPTITLPAHSTPIGITFLDQSQFPDTFKTDAIVALHGSWNRKNPNGYALVRVLFEDNHPVRSEPFISGWLQNKNAWGRPVDVAVGKDGMLYVTDDKTGWIYRVSYIN